MAVAQEARAAECAALAEQEKALAAAIGTKIEAIEEALQVVDATAATGDADVEAVALDVPATTAVTEPPPALTEKKTRKKRADDRAGDRHRIYQEIMSAQPGVPVTERRLREAINAHFGGEAGMNLVGRDLARRSDIYVSVHRKGWTLRAPQEEPSMK
jgi:hypothetical protein